MHFLYEIIPVFLFFITFKVYGIYTATKVGIAASAIQVSFSRIFLKKWDKAQIITLIVFTVFGSMTLYFHNAIFIKWKPTIVFWLFAIVILGSHFLMEKSLPKRIMEHALQPKHAIPDRIWRNLSYTWALFFIALGIVNLYIAYQFDDNAWVNFKFYGITSALFILSIAQAVYLMPFLSEKKQNDQ
jgi:intracellular septation protein